MQNLLKMFRLCTGWAASVTIYGLPSFSAGLHETRRTAAELWLHYLNSGRRCSLKSWSPGHGCSSWTGCWTRSHRSSCRAVRKWGDKRRPIGVPTKMLAWQLCWRHPPCHPSCPGWGRERTGGCRLSGLLRWAAALCCQHCAGPATQNRLLSKVQAGAHCCWQYRRCAGSRGGIFQNTFSRQATTGCALWLRSCCQSNINHTQCVFPFHSTSLYHTDGK